MKNARLMDMVKGWFVGDFDPVVYRTTGCEVAIKRYNAGDQEERHYHRVATELTAVVSGTIMMFGKKWTEGDIVVVEPGESTDFHAISDTITVVVKLPSVKDDKFVDARSLGGSGSEAEELLHKDIFSVKSK